MLGAAGVSFSLVSGASSAMDGLSANPLTPVSQQMTLHEEEISDVSLATFHVFDKENIGTQRPHVRLTLGACGGGGCGCGGCGCACGIGLYYHYTPPVFGGPVYPPPPQLVRPTHKYRHRATGT
jgi:hypothetical protein